MQERPLAGSRDAMAEGRVIRLRGVEVHNLQSVDLDLPHGKLIVLCGISGSGKSSLAFDTLYAEGQRRYLESFSPYTRQFLERLERPDADHIDGIPAAVAVAGKQTARSGRATVGTATEAYDHLRLLWAKIGRPYCRCGREVTPETPQSAAASVSRLPAGTRLMVTFSPQPIEDDAASLLADLQRNGFVRFIIGEQLHSVERGSQASLCADGPIYVVVDRVVAGRTEPKRLNESLETAFQMGGGTAYALIEVTDEKETAAGDSSWLRIDGRRWRRMAFSEGLHCGDCGDTFPAADPRLFSFNSPLGACGECEGFGNLMDIDEELVVPDPDRSIADGAIAPWNTPAYAHELEELLALADDYGLPVDVPYRELSDENRRLIREGVPERDFGGLRGFFAWLDRRKYRMPIRVFLSRWRSYRTCPVCDGARLNETALAFRVAGKHIAEVGAMKIRDAAAFFGEMDLSAWEQSVSRMMLDQVRARLDYLQTVGLGYLTLDRPLRTLSGGEAQRVALTGALGSSLVNLLYILDEPTAGLHPRDTARLLEAIFRLRDCGNTLVVVEHDESVLRAADQLVEFGPGAGEAGGRIVFQGSPAEIETAASSLTGDYLAGRRRIRAPSKRRSPHRGWIRLKGARGNNLRNLSVEFPLGLLCVVTGVSGAGKSTLVPGTLYPALCRRLRKPAPKSYPYDDVYGDGQLGDVILVDQRPIARSSRSNPVTYVKAFDEIRALFAQVPQARTRNYAPGRFSFNVEGGRCEVCQGEGQIRVDMQFMADITMRCQECGGKRYLPEVLEITYRGRNIAEVLEMTVRDAFVFFRGRPKVQTRLKRLIDVGLDYIRLGQPVNTLSGGEAQRLKLAGHLSSARRGRSLFILDEPTTGLHLADIVQLLDCFDALIEVGHSLIVIEHSLELIKAADYVIDLGPDAAENGGQIVCEGTPEFVSRCSASITGRFLAQAIVGDVCEQSA